MAVGFRSDLICVLGGTGFVGRCLVSRLARAGWRVVVPTRSRVRARQLLVLPGVEVVEADVHDPAQLAAITEGSDCVINLIGILNERGHDGAGFRRVHVELVDKIVRACQETGVRKLLHMSALKASAERGPSYYLRTKGEAERIISTLAGDELQYTIFQASVIFGPHDTFVNRFARLMRIFPALAVPRLSARFAPVYVQDIAQAFARAVSDDATNQQTYQLCGPDVYSLKEILELIKEHADLRCILLELPDVLGQLQAFTFEYLVPGRIFSLDNFRSLSIASVCSENGLTALGIEPHSLEAILPTYLTGHRHQDQLSEFRQHAGR